MSRSPSDTRDELVRATQEAIRDLGTPMVTAREIAGRASANLASIPYHFGSKDALIAEALVAEASELTAPVLTLLRDERPGPERAIEGVSLLSELFERSRGQVPVYLAALAAAPHNADVRDGLESLWHEVRSGLAGDVQRQLDAGQLPDWVSPEPMAALILALINGVVIASVVDPAGPDHRKVAAQFLSLLLAAGGLPGMSTAPAAPTAPTDQGHAP